MNPYPSEEELKKITDWHYSNDFFLLIEYIRDLWYYDSPYFVLEDKGIEDGKHKYRFELHTGGWSGNEDIIDALQNNLVFWHMYWMKSERGGHYYFDFYQIQK